MRLTSQPLAKLFDSAWSAQRLRELGVCLTDRRWTPLGAADDFFLRYAVPALKTQGLARGVTTAIAQVSVTRKEVRQLGLIAFNGATPPADTIGSAELAEMTRALPCYSQAALERLASNLPSLLETRSRLAQVSQELDYLSQQLCDTYEELSLVYQIGSTMAVNSPTGEFLQAACRTTASVMELRGLGVLVWGRSLPELEPLMFGSVGLSPEEVQRLSKLLEQLITAEGEAGGLLINDVSQSPQLAWLSAKATQILVVPMQRHGEILGCLVALDKAVPPEIFGAFNRGVFTSIDRKLLAGVSVHVALFLENRKLFQDTESLMMGLLHSLVAAVDAKDAYTCGHSVRVGLYAKRLAEAAGFEAPFADRAYLAGLLHDVGKIGVDDAVLRKPGKLTAEEFAQIQRHPEIGFRILKGIAQVQDILPGVLYHHEKYGGGGYPQNLAGEAIPLLGRVLCIADSFDAMTSSRTYRTAMSAEDAMEEIRRCQATQFDPALAGVFCGIPMEQLRQLMATQRRVPDFGFLQRAA